MSIGDIIGVPGGGAVYRPPVTGTATIDVCDVERLMAQRDKARAERDRARELGARLEQIVAKDHELLWRLLDEPTSHAEAERLGFEVATWLNEVALVSLDGAS